MDYNKEILQVLIHISQQLVAISLMLGIGFIVLIGTT